MLSYFSNYTTPTRDYKLDEKICITLCIGKHYIIGQRPIVDIFIILRLAWCVIVSIYYIYKG